MNLDQIKELAGHRDVSPWVIKLVQDAVEIERENCAKVCDEKGKYFLDMLTGMIPIKPDVLTGALMCAAAIRAKGEK